MSANKNYSKAAVQKKSFCKVCKDAGKEESVYTGHNIRNERNKVVCPLLLSQSCFKCTALGHTPKYCPQGKNEEKIQKRRDYKDRSDAASKINNEMRVSRSASYFGVLCVDTNEEVVVPEKKIKAKKAVVSDEPTYASVLRTQARQPAPVPIVMQAPPKIVVEKKLSWADCVSSDDDDDDEEEEELDYDY
jgi:hypothetical protein